MKSRKLNAQGFAHHFLLALIVVGVACVGTYYVVFSKADTLNASPLVSSASGRCLDVADYGTANRSPVVIYDCNGSAYQKWSMSTDGAIRSQASGRCLDVANYGTANRSPVVIYDCNGSNYQKWTIGSSGSLVSSASGRCLDVLDYGTTNRSSVGIYDCNNSPYQNWGVSSGGSGGDGSCPPGATCKGATTASCTIKKDNKPTIGKVTTYTTTVTNPSGLLPVVIATHVKAKGYDSGSGTTSITTLANGSEVVAPGQTVSFNYRVTTPSKVGGRPTVEMSAFASFNGFKYSDSCGSSWTVN